MAAKVSQGGAGFVFQVLSESEEDGYRDGTGSSVSLEEDGTLALWVEDDDGYGHDYVVTVTEVTK